MHDFKLPLKYLQEWFSEEIVSCKRQKLANLIKSLMEEQGIKVEEIGLPVLTFTNGNSASVVIAITVIYAIFFSEFANMCSFVRQDNQSRMEDEEEEEEEDDEEEEMNEEDEQALKNQVHSSGTNFFLFIKFELVFIEN